MAEKKATMQMIADRLGITKVSVSKALNGQPGVSDDLKRRIIEVSHEIGYSKNTRTQRAIWLKMLGFLVPKRFFLENENFYTVIYYYLDRACAKNKKHLNLYIISPDDEKKLAYPYSFMQDPPDGLFVAGEIDEKYLHMLLNLKMPTVAIDFYKPDMKVDHVVTDNFYSGYTAAVHLIENGHRSIGFIGNPEATSSIMDRYYGYRKALDQNKLMFEQKWHIRNAGPSGVISLDYALPDDLPSAFLCHCDLAAYHLMLKLQARAITVPDQVSIVSFDNTELSKKCNPPLTTIDISKKEIAIKSMEQMLWRIDHMAEAPRRILLENQLIVRNSVRRLQ